VFATDVFPLRFAGVGVVLDFEILEEFVPPLRRCIRAAL